jgi:hypothetical protein
MCGNSLAARLEKTRFQATLRVTQGRKHLYLQVLRYHQVCQVDQDIRRHPKKEHRKQNTQWCVYDLETKARNGSVFHHAMKKEISQTSVKSSPMQHGEEG